MSKALTLYAGSSALKEINKNGLSPQSVKVLAAAAGGPKWFILYGLDRYLFGDFFSKKRDCLQTVGASAGAWRMACLAQQNPVAAIERLALNYSEETYTEKPDAAEISEHARIMLDKVLGETGADEIVKNNRVHSHFVTNRCKGLIASDNEHIQMAGLLASASCNAFSRTTLKYFFDRVVFHSQVSDRGFFNFDRFPTYYHHLSVENIRPVLLASGSIPVVLEGVKNIPGSEPGIYRDGGVTDYHFDFPFLKEKGIVLYPHFSRTILPGWFDKHLPWRKITPQNYHNVLLAVPSESFVAKLPYGKISDRSDFKNLADKERIQYFKTVLKEGEKLAEEFAQLVENGTGIDQIKPLFPAN